MTKDEITTLYRRGGCTYKQIRVLAELNACGIEEIIDVLINGGYKIPKRFKAVVPEDKKECIDNAEPKRANFVTIQNVRYKQPFNMSDKMWNEYVENIRSLQKLMLVHKRAATKDRNTIKEYESRIPELQVDAEWHDLMADGVQKDIDSFCRYLLEMEVVGKMREEQ